MRSGTLIDWLCPVHLCGGIRHDRHDYPWDSPLHGSDGELRLPHVARPARLRVPVRCITEVPEPSLRCDGLHHAAAGRLVGEPSTVSACD
jgi:hypothetical protein